MSPLSIQITTINSREWTINNQQCLQTVVAPNVGSDCGATKASLWSNGGDSIPTWVPLKNPDIETSSSPGQPHQLSDIFTMNTKQDAEKLLHIPVVNVVVINSWLWQ